jgi:hypothetical protein
MPLFPRTPIAGPKIFANLAANQPKRNIRVCCGPEGRTVLFCEECHGRGYEYDEMKHREGCCHTAEALAIVEVHPTAAPITVAV